jgi:hypothetical protein
MIKRFDFRYNRESDKLLLLLISTDLLFVLLHIMHTHSPFFNHRYWNIAIDRGFAESFQYVKEFWIVLMFFILAGHYFSDTCYWTTLSKFMKG